MTFLAKPSSFSAAATYALGPVDIVPGVVLDVGPGDVAVMIRDRGVAGVLGPGRHALDPNVYPFLWKLADASGRLSAEVLFVALQGFGARPLDAALAGALERAVSEALHTGWQPQQIAAHPDTLFTRLRELTHAGAGGAPAAGKAPVASAAAAAGTLPADPALAAPAASPLKSSEPVYEMLWDCRHCGEKKLLGLTHRHCPQCGSPQNATERYFPSDEEKVAVQNHVYYGADRICHYCQNPNSRRSKHCGTCGGPLEEGTDVNLRKEQVHAPGAYRGETAEDARRERAPQAMAAPPKKQKSGGKVVGRLLLLLLFGAIAFAIAAIFWTKPAALEVTGHEWKREIDIERFGPVQETAWCDQTPPGARVLRQTQAVRSQQRVKTGEKCRTKKIDQGDGTFRESRVCEPVYENKPVYSAQCRYTIDKWAVARTATSNGTSLSPAPSWPTVKLAREGQCVGCEREGERRETYIVKLAHTETKEAATCKVGQAKWQSFTVGSRWKGEVGVLLSNLDCGSLTRQ